MTSSLEQIDHIVILMLEKRSARERARYFFCMPFVSSATLILSGGTDYRCRGPPP
jgi:hypothetical protein